MLSTFFELQQFKGENKHTVNTIQSWFYVHNSSAFPALSWSCAWSHDAGQLEESSLSR